MWLICSGDTTSVQVLYFFITVLTFMERFLSVNCAISLGDINFDSLIKSAEETNYEITVCY